MDSNKRKLIKSNMSIIHFTIGIHMKITTLADPNTT